MQIIFKFHTFQIRRKVQNLNVIFKTKFVFQNTLVLSALKMLTNFVKREQEIRDDACFFIAVLSIAKNWLDVKSGPEFTICTRLGHLCQNKI